VFGPQPRSYDYALPRKVERGALRAALMQKLQARTVTVVQTLTASEVKTKAAAEMLRTLGADGKTLLVDVTPDDRLALAVRNIAGVRFVRASHMTARDVADASRVIATRAAVERLQEVLG
jgi:large subunit ribosomal protein L4